MSRDVTSRDVIRLPGVPVSRYRPQRRRRLVVPIAASLGLLASCTTFGTNIKGSFACGAVEGGSCAPATVIDDKALAEITGDAAYRPAGPYPAPTRELAFQRMAYSSAGSVAVTPQKILRIVFPAHVDGAGRYHETSVVQALVDNGQWLAATDGHGPALGATSVLNVNPELLSQLGGAAQSTLPVAASDAQALSRAEQRMAGAQQNAQDNAAADVPSVAAVAAARARVIGAGGPVVGRVGPVRSGEAQPASPEMAQAGARNRPATFDPRVED